MTYTSESEARASGPGLGLVKSQARPYVWAWPGLAYIEPQARASGPSLDNTNLTQSIMESMIIMLLRKSNFVHGSFGTAFKEIGL